MHSRIRTKGVFAVAFCVAALNGSAVESNRPAKIGQADMAGAIFNGPGVKKIVEGGWQALEVNTLTSADQHFTTGMYKAGPQHLDMKDGFPEYGFFYFITGSIKLTDADGTVQVIGPGEAVSIPKGWKGRWDTDGYSNVWATYYPDAK